MKKVKLTLGIIAFLCLSINISTLAYANESKITIKVPTDLENHWSKSNVTKLMERNVINGYEDGTFRPDAEITVAEFVKILMVNNQIELGETGSNWYDEYINGARELGLIQGGEITDYNRAINRVEMAKLIDRALNLGGTPFIKYEDSRKFGANVSLIRRVSHVGIINGYEDGTFRPYANATRGEASTMIKRVNDYLDGKVITPKVENIPVYNTDGSWTDDWFLDNLKNLKRYTNYSTATEKGGVYQYDGRKMIVASNNLKEVEIIPIEDEVINERIFKVLKYFTQKAYETNRYARVNHISVDNPIIVVDFSSKHNIFSRGDLEVEFPLYPDEYMERRFPNNIEEWNVQRVDVKWDIGKMFDFRCFPSELNGDDILEGDYLVAHDYILEPYGQVLEGVFKLLYGDDYKEIIDYVLKERTTELNLGSYENLSQVEINGIKIHNFNAFETTEYFLTELK